MQIDLTTRRSGDRRTVTNKHGDVHRVLVKDDLGRPIAAVVHVGQAIIHSAIGDDDFRQILAEHFGITSSTKVEMVGR